MSEKNIELVRRILEAWSRDDLSGFLAICAEEIEWHPVFESRLEGEASAYRGHDGMRRAWNAYREIWEEVAVTPVEFRDLGERILLLGRIHGRGKGSGMPFDAPLSMLFTFRDDKVVRCEDYPSHEGGLRAAGRGE